MFAGAYLGLLALLGPGEIIERPYADFDAVIAAVAPQGRWQPDERRKFVFVPTAAADPSWAPYREGRWIYTDYGWTWRGNSPVSWATDHYGFWERVPEQGWRWVPGPHWLPGAVEWIQSGGHVGWRCTPLDRFGNPQQSETERYRDPGEWNFVPKEKLRGPLTPADFADRAQAEQLLVQARPLDHIFTAHREIGRPGAPPDVLAGPDGKLPAFPVLRDLPEVDTALAPSPAVVAAYRPRFHQDADGIFRRVELFLNPRKENPEAQTVRETLAPERKLTPKEEKAMRDAAERERLQRKHWDDLYR